MLRISLRPPTAHGARAQAAALAALAAVVLAVSTACSTSPGSTANASSGGSVGTSAPIVIGGVGPLDNPQLSQPEREGAIQAAAGAINAAGGFKGHPLKVDFCNTLNTANGEIACMQQLSSAKVSAILAPGIINDQSGRAYMLAQQAGVPVIGGQGLTPTEFTTPNIFPMASGIPGWAYGSVAALVDAGAKHMAFLGVTTDPASSFITGLNTAALKSAGLTPVRTVLADPDTDPTFAVSAAEVIARGVDGVVIDLQPALMPKAVTALRAAGYKGYISSITALFDPATLKALGSQANGVLLTGQLAFTSDTRNPGVARFLADMRKYSPGSEVDETSELAYAAVQLFAKAASSARGTTPGDILTAMQHLDRPVSIGLAGPYQVMNSKRYLSAFPDIYNPTVQNGVVRDGVIVADGAGFFNPFSSLLRRAGVQG
jgi:branched-chain amino acid transport system substrate-binding protein